MTYVVFLIIPFTLQRALKRIKVKPGTMDWMEFTSLREIQVLAALTTHPNVVRLHDAIYSTQGHYFLVFEYAPQGSVFDAMARLRDSKAAANKPLFPDSQITSILHDTLEGLQHIHAHGYFHRDIKPANLLLFQNTCKIADFTLARPTLARSSSRRNANDTSDVASRLTTYVSTRWYRAPELLLQSPTYSTPVDVYAVGCVAAELYDAAGQPLFAGNSEVDQLFQIFCALGVPSVDSWAEGVRLMQRLNMNMDPMDESLLSRLPSYLKENTLDWMRHMLALCPEERPSAAHALRHPFFTDNQSGIEILPLISPQSSTPSTTSLSPQPAAPAERTNRVVRNPYKKTC